MPIAPTKEDFTCSCGHSYDQHGHSDRFSKCRAILDDGTECPCEIDRGE